MICRRLGRFLRAGTGTLLEKRTAQPYVHHPECTTRTLALQIPPANPLFQAQDVALPRMPRAPLRIETPQRGVDLALQLDSRRTSKTTYNVLVPNAISPYKRTLSSRL